MTTTSLNAFTFDEVIAYGREHGSSVVDGVPWSFRFYGIAFTHERDNAYIIAGTTWFRQGDYLVVRKDARDVQFRVAATDAPTITVRR